MCYVGGPGETGIGKNGKHIGLVNVKFSMQGKKAYAVQYGKKKMTGYFGFIYCGLDVL